jgi:hypothetical protein
MPSPVRMKKTTARVRQGEPQFVVQVAVPDGGFGCTLDAVNAWHRYSNNTQRRGRPQRLGKREFWSWCFEGLEIAKSFRHRFGGQIVPVTIRPLPERRRDLASQIPDVVKSECEGSEQKSGTKQTSSQV